MKMRELHDTINEYYARTGGDPRDLGIAYGVYPSVGDCYYILHHYDSYIYGYRDERGGDNVIGQSSDPMDIVYEVIKNQIAQVATDYELHHRVYWQDFRRVLFQKRLELMRLVDEQFYLRLQEEINEILKNAPYNDHDSPHSDAILQYITTLKKIIKDQHYHKRKLCIRSINTIYNKIQSPYSPALADFLTIKIQELLIQVRKNGVDFQKYSYFQELEDVSNKYLEVKKQSE